MGRIGDVMHAGARRLGQSSRVQHTACPGRGRGGRMRHGGGRRRQGRVRHGGDGGRGVDGHGDGGGDCRDCDVNESGFQRSTSSFDEVMLWRNA